MKNLVRVMPATLLCLISAGCARNPNVDIFGSYFPGWMISLALGVGLTGAAHSVLSRMALMRAAGHPALIYPSLLLLFTCLLWLCFFA